MTADMSWDSFDGPRHADELAVAHGGQPSPEVQSRTHGAPAPAVDNGPDDATKYGGMPA